MIKPHIQIVFSGQVNMGGSSVEMSLLVAICIDPTQWKDCPFSYCKCHHTIEVSWQFVYRSICFTFVLLTPLHSHSGIIESRQRFYKIVF
jgi:hypothetical protein